MAGALMKEHANPDGRLVILACENVLGVRNASFLRQDLNTTVPIGRICATRDEVARSPTRDLASGSCRHLATC